MEAFVRLTALGAPLMRANIDTDQIIPTRFLARLSDHGVGEGLFAEWRRLPDGSPDPDFVLNRSPWDQAQILVAGPNFGCGSSREAAPRALRECGFRAIIAAGFGDIFYGNCFRNGILPVRLPEAVVEGLAQGLTDGVAGRLLTVDLAGELAGVPGGAMHAFRTPPLLRRMLLEGLDEIALTLTRAERIATFREGDRARRPWAYALG
jgi:3-isopropylmalate/(R)-2-methylmalate dehydratase small subunit